MAAAASPGWIVCSRGRSEGSSAASMTEHRYRTAASTSPKAWFLQAGSHSGRRDRRLPDPRKRPPTCRWRGRSGGSARTPHRCLHPPGRSRRAAPISSPATSCRTTTRTTGATPPGALIPGTGQAERGDRAERVRGVYCKNEHFNDPRMLFCAVCGINMVQQTPVLVEGPRPPLGVVVVDDGAVFQWTGTMSSVGSRTPTNVPTTAVTGASRSRTWPARSPECMPGSSSEAGTWSSSTTVPPTGRS